MNQLKTGFTGEPEKQHRTYSDNGNLHLPNCRIDVRDVPPPHTFPSFSTVHSFLD